jgi:hypothetical protein
MVFCNKCGTKNPDDAQYCENCGNTLSKEPIPELPTQQEQIQQPDKQSSSGAGAIVLIAVIVLVLVFAFGLGWHNITLLNGSTGVNAVGYRYYWFDVPSVAINPTISGTFEGSGSLG